MPYKSDAQRRYFHAAEERGDISHKTVHEFDEASKGKHLPEKVEHKAHGGECYACGGPVPHDHPANKHYMAHGGAIEPEAEDGPLEPRPNRFEAHLIGRYKFKRPGSR